MSTTKRKSPGRNNDQGPSTTTDHRTTRVYKQFTAAARGGHPVEAVTSPAVTR